jgi:hypothetical protein
MNLLVIVYVGALTERLFGRRRLLIIYVLSALGGGLASAFLHDVALSVGASAAGWGMMTALLALLLRPRGLLPTRMVERVRRGMVKLLVLNLALSMIPGVDLYAHLGGGLVGFALVASGVLTRGLVSAWDDAAEPVRPSRRTEWVVSSAAIIATTALVGSLAVAWIEGRPWELARSPVLKRVQLVEAQLSIDVPEAIADTLRAEQRRGRWSYTLRELGQPIWVEVDVARLDEAIAPADETAYLEGAQRELETLEPVTGARLAGDPKLVTLGARRYAFAQYDAQGRAVRVWIGFFGDRDVLVRVFTDGLPDAWAGIETRIITSLGTN